ncbi:MAG TPA: glycosyltransferase family 4 protein [Abditibacteriaceae bacterium]|jgi:glycosyltransferase involved in cell wall biosynthesis
MRILMTADAVGGVWTYALELVRALEPHGVAVVLATMGPLPGASQRNEAQQLSNLQLVESSFKLEWMDEPWHDLERAGEWLLELESSTQPDVIHLNGYVHGALPRRAPLLVAGHSCVLSWWQEVKGEDAPATWNRYRDAVRRGLHSADLVAAPTQAMLDMLCRNYGELSSTRVVPNGREETLFSPVEKKPYILSAGRLWDEAKNLSALNAVAAQLHWPIYVAGDAQHPRDAQHPQEAQQSGGVGIQSLQVNALGKLPQNELRHWMAEAAIYALPARYEPFGLSALEAALSGCALVLGDIASLREVWQDAALFVPPDDHEALAAALQSLIDDELQRITMSERALARALQFSAAHMAQNYFQIYTQLKNCPTRRQGLPLSV